MGSGVYLCGFASQFATQFGPIANQTSNWFATLPIKNKRKRAIKKGWFTWISRNETTNLTLYLNIDDLRPFSRTTVTFKMISIKMWYLIRAAIKNVRINLGQLRIKRQIDSQLRDSICAAYVQAWFRCFHLVIQIEKVNSMCCWLKMACTWLDGKRSTKLIMMVVVSDNLEFSSGLLFLLTVIVKCSAQTTKKLEI